MLGIVATFDVIGCLFEVGFVLPLHAYVDTCNIVHGIHRRVCCFWDVIFIIVSLF